MTLSPDLLEIVVDPVDKQSLQYLESENALYNERSKKKYVIGPNGIAILLADEAESVSDDEHERLMKLVASGHSVATGAKGPA